MPYGLAVWRTHPRRLAVSHSAWKSPRVITQRPDSRRTLTGSSGAAPSAARQHDVQLEVRTPAVRSYKAAVAIFEQARKVWAIGAHPNRHGANLDDHFTRSAN